jgi:hypothetical protein
LTKNGANGSSPVDVSVDSPPCGGRCRQIRTTFVVCEAGRPRTGRSDPWRARSRSASLRSAVGTGLILAEYEPGSYLARTPGLRNDPPSVPDPDDRDRQQRVRESQLGRAHPVGAPGVPTSGRGARRRSRRAVRPSVGVRAAPKRGRKQSEGPIAVAESPVGTRGDPGRRVCAGSPGGSAMCSCEAHTPTQVRIPP